MKILCILLTVFSLQLSARGYSQGITLSLKNASLEKLFKLVEQQTTYKFVYSDEEMELSKPVSIDVKNESLDNVLKLSFANQTLGYLFDGKLIIIKIPDKKKEQQIEYFDIHGKVVNEAGEPIVGAIVSIKDSKTIAITDEQGEFNLKIPTGEETIVITAINIERLEIKVVGQSNLNTIVAKTAIKGLAAVIVNKGYYSTLQILNTGDVSKVTSEELSRQPVSNPLGALEGRVPGLLITQQNGVPGSNFNVLIQGRNSIINGVSPLYIIDGVPFLNNSEILTQRGGTIHNSPFNTIDPMDIESIEILKDADATAIYGSKGANGVIVITTKRPKPGKTKVDFDVYYGTSKVTRTPKLMNTDQYLEMRREAFKNDGVVPTAANAKDLLIYDTTRYTDFKRLLIGGMAQLFNSNIRISGGNEYTTVSAAGNLSTETTVFPNSKPILRSNINVSFFHKSNDGRFLISSQASLSSSNNKLSPTDLTQYINLPPDLPPLYDSLGHLTWRKGTASYNNPLSSTLQSYNVLTDRLTGNITLNYRILKHLNFKTNIGGNYIDVDEKILGPISSLDPAFAPTGSAFFGKSSSKTWIVEPQVNYELDVTSKNKIQALIGATLEGKEESRNAIDAIGYTNDDLLNSVSGAQSATASNSLIDYRYFALFARLNYEYNKKYLVNLTARRDGSSRFGTDHRFANFGALGLGWIFTNEKFFKSFNSIFNYGKLRLSYGLTGNDLINDYQYLDTYMATLYPYNGSIGLQPSRLYNGDYSWEQIRKFEAGLEFSIIKNKISVNLSWFFNRSDNQIINYNLPGQTGFTSILKNFPGIVSNKGFEIAITSTNIRQSHFEWNTSFNLTIPKNKLVAFPGLSSSSYASQFMIGRPLNLKIGYEYLGVDPQTGVYTFNDINKDNSLNNLDYIYNGTSDPKYYGGIENSFIIKNVDISFLCEFRRQLGLDLIYGIGGRVGDATNRPVVVLNRWRNAGDIAPYQKFTQSFGAANSAMSNVRTSDAALTNASFFRLKNLSLGYNMPNHLLKKWHIQKLRIYLIAENLVLLTHYLGDPETQSPTTLPPLKTFSGGFHITF